MMPVSSATRRASSGASGAAPDLIKRTLWVLGKTPASAAWQRAISMSLMASGYCLDFIGYKVPKNAEAVMQSPEEIWRLGVVTFVLGAFICLLSLLAIRKYPLTRS